MKKMMIKNRYINVRIKEQIYTKIEERCDHLGIGKSEYVRVLIGKDLDSYARMKKREENT